MKKQLTLLIVAASLLLITCKKRSGSDEPEAAPVKLLSRIIEVSGFPKPTTTFTIYTYDDEKRISTIKTGGTTTTTYSYHGDELFSIDTKFGNSRNLAEFSYADGKPKQIVRKSYIDGVLQKQVTLGNIYTGDRLQKFIQMNLVLLYKSDFIGILEIILLGTIVKLIYLLQRNPLLELKKTYILIHG